MENLFPANVSRRVFVKGIGFVSIGLVLGTMGGCEELAEEIKHRPIRRRLRTGSAAVDADIATYKHAVELMKALPASDPRSWTAQAEVHGTVAGGFLYCQHGTDHFFDWHRAYLLYFERICQKLTGKKKFGLPYWNWNQNPDINPAFLDPASALFLARTRTSMTGSWSVTTPALDPIFADTNFFTFRPQIEGTPHNTVVSAAGACCVRRKLRTTGHDVVTRQNRRNNDAGDSKFSPVKPFRWRRERDSSQCSLSSHFAATFFCSV